MSAATVVVGEKLAAADLGVDRPSAFVAAVVREDRDAILDVLDSVCDRDKNLRFDAERLGGGKKLFCWVGDEMGGEFGPRKL